VTTEEFRQCELKRAIGDGKVATMTGWVPANIAVVGQTVRVKHPEWGTWTEGWEVVSTGDEGLSGNASDDHARDER
jgi:hypothetical protein